MNRLKQIVAAYFETTPLARLFVDRGESREQRYDAYIRDNTPSG